MTGPKIRAAKVGRPTESPGKVKKALLTATTRLLNTVGPKGTTARAICSEAGVGAPVIYYHYGDLVGLYRAAIEASFQRVALSYRRSAKSHGPLQGIRDSWALFMHFAYDEPQMCRLVIEHVLHGEPPLSIKRTLKSIARDIEGMTADGSLALPAKLVADALWVAALGSAGFIATERQGAPPPDAAVQSLVLDAILLSLFVETPAGSRA